MSYDPNVNYWLTSQGPTPTVGGQVTVHGSDGTRREGTLNADDTVS